jgi:putative ABC transport system substrate-binding protein
MNRRDFMTLLTGTAAAWPLAARAQQPTRIIRVGFLMPVPPTAVPTVVAAFREGLRERGYIEGQNLLIDYRWPEGSSGQSVAAAAAELARSVDIIVAWGGQSVIPARRATSTIPIVMIGVADPVGLGFVASLSRPAGNITGLSNFARILSAKLVQMFTEIVPDMRHIGVVRNPGIPGVTLQLQETEEAILKRGLQLLVVEARSPEEFKSAFARFNREGVGGVLLLADPSLLEQAPLIAELARGARLPTAFQRRENVDAGGLFSYGPNLADQLRLVSTYVDRILRGAKPADLPVQQPTKIELVINLKTAKALGLTIPAILLATADEVIE